MAARDEQTLCGRHAVLAALQRRPDDVLRLFYAAEHRTALRSHLQALAARRAVYREVGADELERLAGSRAHQGLVAILRPLPTPATTAAELQRWAGRTGVWLALDGVANPHNLGAIARTAAFLGVQGLVVAGPGAASVRSAAASRTAEGGLEAVPVWRSADLLRDIRALQAAGGQAVALALDGSEGLATLRGAGRQGCWLLLAGAEETGVRPDVARACARRVRIEGTDAVESLNVGVAVGIALSWLLAT